MVFTLATVTEDTLAAIRSLEAEIGAPLLAMAQVDVAPARLDRERLARIEALEKELGIVLVAVGNGEDGAEARRPRRTRRA